MPRTTLMRITIAVAIAVAIGAIAEDGFAASHAACSLLTSDDVAAVLGGPVRPQDTAGDPTECIYNTDGTQWDGEDATVTLIVQGGRAEYEQGVSWGAKYGQPYTQLSGLGNKASENNHCGEQCSQVGVLKGNTYFSLMVQLDPNHAKSAVALARKVASRL
jgi:hypothetical protein